MQPSPAAAGRVSLILKSSLNEKQGRALVDDLQASVMSQHSERWTHAISIECSLYREIQKYRVFLKGLINRELTLCNMIPDTFEKHKQVLYVKAWNESKDVSTKFSWCKIIFSFKIKQRLFKPKEHKLAEVVCGLQLKWLRFITT